MTEQVPSDQIALEEKPTGKLRWHRRDAGNPVTGIYSPPRLQQFWRVQYWQNGCIFKQYEEWRDVPEETGP
jgi:hypothetical protein